MMIEEKFRELSEKDEGAYMPHVYYGDPSREFSLKEIKTLSENGADLLEFGIPFSDPTADGPIFQDACDRALKNGITPKKCIRGIKDLRGEGMEIPIVVTTYYNIPYAFGVEEFVEEMRNAGAQGLIIPNIPVEESSELRKICEENDIRLIFQVTPNTSKKRVEKIAKASKGFLYIVNFEGVTGVRETISKSVKKLIESAKKHTETPLMAGFGISEREHAESLVSAGADGVITGSAIAKIYNKNLENPEDTLPEIGGFAREIKKGCREGYQNR